MSLSSASSSCLSPTSWKGISLWHARALTAHERLLQAREPSMELWEQVQTAFETCQSAHALTGTGAAPMDDDKDEAALPNDRLAVISLELGLAMHYFDRPGMGRLQFLLAQKQAGLQVQVTGAIGKRTKYQQVATAQMLVKATSSHAAANTAVTKHNETQNASAEKPTNGDKTALIKEQMIEHPEDEILLERIRFEDENENKISQLSILDQTILLALCLDVKNSNPSSDVLTAEEMAAFLATVLDHHDDWMVYSTALLERAWLEFDKSHGRERAILQLQALADQHLNRLTLTQSTRKSIEESAPVQDRLKYLHSIVYPPRWLMLQDLADRYAALGIVTSAAELYTEIECWDSVVECYRRAGKVGLAERIVRERLAIQETPRMWNALGDLTNDPQYYEKAVHLSKGRFSNAYVSLGRYYFEKGQLEKAAEYYECSVKLRPLAPAVWFRMGTIYMQLQQWDKALRAFSEVVQQEPEEGDAWANVAAIHMHNKRPSEAYPALQESLKHNRNNWRVWVSKIYTCLDLAKYDEAVQACNVILDLKTERQASDGIPALEEKVIRAIVGGVIRQFHENKGNEVALDSSRRSLSRVHALLDRISCSAHSEPWVFEIMAFFYEQVGKDDKVLEYLMKEYRALSAVPSWEKNNAQISRVCQVVSQIVGIHRQADSATLRENLTKARFLLRGVVTTINTARPDDQSLPDGVGRLSKLLTDVEEQLKTL